MSHFQCSAWHTVTWMALLTFVLNNVSLLNLDSLFFYRSSLAETRCSIRGSPRVYWLIETLHSQVSCTHGHTISAPTSHLSPPSQDVNCHILLNSFPCAPTTSPCDTYLPPLSTQMCREAQRNHILKAATSLAPNMDQVLAWSWRYFLETRHKWLLFHRS